MSHDIYAVPVRGGRLLVHCRTCGPLGLAGNAAALPWFATHHRQDVA